MKSPSYSGADLYAIGFRSSIGITSASKAVDYGVYRPFYALLPRYSDSFGLSGGLGKLGDDILNEIFSHYGVTEISKQIDICKGGDKEPTKERVESLVLLEARNEGRDIEAYKRTKEYFNSVDRTYSDLVKRFKHIQNYLSDLCTYAVVPLHDASEQLPYIYDYCNADSAAFKGAICKLTPEEVLNGKSGRCTSMAFKDMWGGFHKCIKNFKIIEDDYVTSSKYFATRMKKIMDDRAEEADNYYRNVREAEKRQDEANWKAIEYMTSPRGKCESECNEEYSRGSSSWNTCMSVCKDMRSN